jgi:hypothetical protein
MHHPQHTSPQFSTVSIDVLARGRDHLLFFYYPDPCRCNMASGSRTYLNVPVGMKQYAPSTTLLDLANFESHCSVT